MITSLSVRLTKYCRVSMTQMICQKVLLGKLRGFRWGRRTMCSYSKLVLYCRPSSLLASEFGLVDQYGVLLLENKNSFTTSIVKNLTVAINMKYIYSFCIYHSNTKEQYIVYSSEQRLWLFKCYLLFRYWSWNKHNDMSWAAIFWKKRTILSVQ